MHDVWVIHIKTFNFPIQFGPIQINFHEKNSQIPTDWFFYQIVMFVLITQSNQRIFTRKILTFQKLNFFPSNRNIWTQMNQRILTRMLQNGILGNREIWWALNFRTFFGWFFGITKSALLHTMQWFLSRIFMKAPPWCNNESLKKSASGGWRF